MNLSQARKQAGLTQAELAAMAGTERAHISRIESYHCDLTEEMAAKLSRPLGMTAAALKQGHEKQALKNYIKRLVKTDGSDVKEIMEDERFGLVIKGMRELIEDEKIPTEVRWAVTKVAERFISLAEQSSASSGRDQWGRRLRA